LAREGVRADVVGEFIGNAAGLGNIGEWVAPRVWVRGEDLERARAILARWARRGPGEAAGHALGDEGWTPEEPPGEPRCDATGALLRVGFWSLGVFGIAVALAMFAVMLREFVRALWRRGPAVGAIESALGALLCGALTVLTALVLRKRLRWASRRLADLEERGGEGAGSQQEQSGIEGHDTSC
jgi:hypothetical protein